MSSIYDTSTPAYPYGVTEGRISLADRVDPGREALAGVNLYGQSPQQGQQVFYLTPDALATFRGLRSATMGAGFNRNLFTLASAYRPQSRQDSLRLAR